MFKPIYNGILALRNVAPIKSAIFTNPTFLSPQSIFQTQQRTVKMGGWKRTIVKCDWDTGKRLSMPEVMDRFYRLGWGGWIRTIAGCKKRLWKKTMRRRHRIRGHVFVNATQSSMLDKMTLRCHTKRRYFVDDPYQAYHDREEYLKTRRKPLPATPYPPGFEEEEETYSTNK